MDLISKTMDWKWTQQLQKIYFSMIHCLCIVFILNMNFAHCFQAYFFHFLKVIWKFLKSGRYWPKEKMSIMQFFPFLNLVKNEFPMAIHFCHFSDWMHVA